MGSKGSKKTPPLLGQWLLRSFCSFDFLSTALWDLEEIYRNNLVKKGKFRANMLYLLHALEVIYHLYFKGKSHYSLNRTAMLKNNIVIALRSFRRNKVHTLLNILGLVSGLVVFILITIYVNHEFSYDQYHKNKDRIHRVYFEGSHYLGSNKFAVTPIALAPALMSDIPEIAYATRFNKYNSTLIKVADQTFLEPVIYATDQETFSIFSFESVAGDMSHFLTEKHTAVLSESAALKYFGKTDVLGEVLHFRNEHPMKIVGVIKNMPKNSHFVMDVILHYGTMMELENRPVTNWKNNSYHTYFMLEQSAGIGLIQDKLEQLIAKYTKKQDEEGGQPTIYHTQPLAQVHFAQGVNFEMAPTADPKRLNTYLAIAFLILIIAAINYMNLATARAIKRTREVGIRKVVGAQNKNLIFQFLLESMLLVFVSMIIALLCVQLILPAFSQFVDRTLVLDFTQLSLWVFLGTLCLSLGLLSGIYPAIVMTSFKPITTIKGKHHSGHRGSLLRNVLVIFQFTISGILILGIIVLSRQLNYIQDADTGYIRDQVVILSVRDQKVLNELSLFKEELRKIPGVTSLASSTSLPNYISASNYADWPGKEEDVELSMYQGFVDYGFIDLYELELVEGRNFSNQIESDKKAILLNESAVKLLGWEHPIGREMITWGGDTGRVIGVLKDFHQHPLHMEIKPLQLSFGDQTGLISIRIEGNQIKETVEAIERKYESFSPEFPFSHGYFDDIFDRAYLTEIKTAKLANWFAALTILVACLGLYGLASYKVEQRIKEVGIRKVLGASIPKILGLLSKDFVKLLFIAFMIAAPIAYYVMDDWLNNFAYHISMGVFTFIITLVVMVLIAGLAVGHRTYKAAVRNPIESLRNE